MIRETLIAAICVVLTPAPVRAGEPDFTKDPVVLVHGYFLGEVGSWTWLKSRLVDAGWPEEYLFSFKFDNVFGCNPQHGYEIAAKVQEALASTGRDKVDILAHSMGGVDARYYIKFLCGYKYVNDFVSLAGAHQGSTVGCLDPINCGGAATCVGPQENAWMQNESLKEINICDMTPWDDIKYTSIWSEFDEIVLPASNSVLDGAMNVEVNSVVEHALILVSEEAAGYVMAALDGAGSNDNIPTANPPCVELCEEEPGPDTADVSEPVLVPEPVPESAPEVVEQGTDLPGVGITLDLTAASPEKPGPDLMPPETAGESIAADKTEQPKVFSHIAAEPRAGGCDAGAGAGAPGVLPALLLGLYLLRRRRLQ